MVEIIKIKLYARPDIEMDKEEFKKFVKASNLDVVFHATPRLIRAFIAGYYGLIIKGTGFKEYTLNELTK